MPDPFPFGAVTVTFEVADDEGRLRHHGDMTMPLATRELLSLAKREFNETAKRLEAATGEQFAAEVIDNR